MMGLEQSISLAWKWAKKEPYVFLAGVLNWIPTLAFSIVALWAVPSIRDIIASNAKDPFSALLAHSAALGQLVLPFLGMLLAVAALTLLSKTLASLALAHAAKQFQDGKPLSLAGAFAAARPRWLRLIGAELLLALAAVAIGLAATLVAVALIISVVGIVLLLVLAIPAILALLAGTLAVAAMLLFLPAIVAFTDSSPWQCLKDALSFVDRNKGASAGLVLLTFVAQWALGNIARALGGPLGGVLDMTVQLAVGTVAALSATAYWLDAQDEQKGKAEEGAEKREKTEEKDRLEKTASQGPTKTGMEARKTETKKTVAIKPGAKGKK